MAPKIVCPALYIWFRERQTDVLAADTHPSAYLNTYTKLLLRRQFRCVLQTMPADITAWWKTNTAFRFHTAPNVESSLINCYLACTLCIYR